MRFFRFLEFPAVPSVLCGPFGVLRVLCNSSSLFYKLSESRRVFRFLSTLFPRKHVFPDRFYSSKRKWKMVEKAVGVGGTRVLVGARDRRRVGLLLRRESEEGLGGWRTSERFHARRETESLTSVRDTDSTFGSKFQRVRIESWMLRSKSIKILWLALRRPETRTKLEF